MKISRIVIKNFRAHQVLDVNIKDDLCCIIGENNTGKTGILRAIQICVDVSLPGYCRNLVREDIHSSVDITNPSQVLIGIEFSDFEGKLNEEALVSTWKTDADRARIFYRFRPRRSVREKISSGELRHGQLHLDDYSWEIKGGGDPAIDLADIEWNEDDIGESVRFSDLQSYLVINLPALRDVEAELRNGHTSPLIRLIESFDIEEEERNQLIAILETANTEISESDSISEIATALENRYKSVAGPAFEMGVSLGLSAATFQAILRNMRLLLSDFALSGFEPGRNGLGMNNVLYVAILIEYFKKRIDRNTSSGQLLLIEEPEAHLHPQLQASLVMALNEFDAQVIMTSHSTHISSQVPFASFVSLTHRSNNTIGAATLSDNPALNSDQISDLERYLDATKSNLLFARKVMLVEGPAELFLIPAMIKAVHGVDLERYGISVIAIHGVHFEVYAKLFRVGSLEKKCAIVADVDLKPSDASEEFEISADAPRLEALRSDFVEVFAGPTTFERELVSLESLPMLISTTRSLGAPSITEQLERGLVALQETTITEVERQRLINELGDIVLRTAKRFGKARFAQVAARYAHQCVSLPAYVQSAFDWLNS